MSIFLPFISGNLLPESHFWPINKLMSNSPLALMLLNQIAPDFEVPATGGAPVKLSDFRGGFVVIYFYPKDSTPGCTTEGTDFRDHFSEFAALDCTIFGLSRDSLKSHENFKAKMNFPFELLSDKDETVCNLFGVMKLKKMYGKEVRGIERSTFIINRDGIVCAEWRGVKVPGHVLAVLESVKSFYE